MGDSHGFSVPVDMTGEGIHLHCHGGSNVSACLVG